MDESYFLKTLNLNPYKVLRVQRKLTQQEVANKIHVTVQYIYRVENGLVNSPPEKLSKFLAPHDTHAYMSENYTAWVHWMREIVKEQNYDNGDECVEAMKMAVRYGAKDLNPFIVLMNYFCTTVGCRVLQQGTVYSQQLFNRLILVHPRATQQFLNREKLFTLPEVLDEALTGVGFSKDNLNLIEDLAAQNAFSARDSHG